MLTPKDRKLRAQIGAYSLHAQRDARETTQRGREASRAALDEELANQVDPDRTLSPEERKRRVEYARKAHFAKLALRSARARREKREKRNGKAKEKSPIGKSAAGGEV